MARKTKKQEKKYYIDENGFTYDLHRNVLDYWNHESFFTENVISEHDLNVLKTLRKEKNSKDYGDEVIEIIKKAERVEVEYFKKYTKRVQILINKIYKKEEHIIKILKNSAFDTATNDIRKIKSLLKGIKELAFHISSEYKGDNYGEQK